MSTLLSLRQALGTAVEKLDSLVSDPKALAAQEKLCDDLETQIAAALRNQERAARLARPAGGGGGGNDRDPNADPTKFANIGEQLMAIQRAAVFPGRPMDERLRAPTGMGETDPSGGGFPIQVDFAQSIMTRLYDMGEIIQRCFRVSISTNANGIKIPGVDETSRATGSRWGGVQSYWVGEGDAGTASKPKFRLIELDLKKLMALWYVTDELMQDSQVLAGIANEAFAEEIMFTVENAIFRATGAGQPQGILNANALVTVATEKGQATKTILYQNILNMWARMWARSRFNAVWFINQNVEPQLYSLNQVIGTAGVPVYMPPGGISERPYATLFGRPVIPIEYASTLGAVGDITLMDLSQYVVADKNAMQQMSSIHVQFLTDQTTFRLTYRIDGQSIWQAALTPFQTDATTPQTQSPFIALAAR